MSIDTAEDGKDNEKTRKLQTMISFQTNSTDYMP